MYQLRYSLTTLLVVLSLVCVIAGNGLPAFASVQETVVESDDLAVEEVYSPFVGRSYPDQVFFGDTHFHTEVSFDAGLVGTTIDIHEAFRFARGERIISNTLPDLPLHPDQLFGATP